MSDEQQNVGEREKESEQKRSIRLRKALAGGYAAIRASEATASFSAMTIEEAFDARIEKIEGLSTELRPNILDRIDKIEADVILAAYEISNLPPEVFREKDENEDANTSSTSTVISEDLDAKQKQVDRLKRLFNETSNPQVKSSLMNQARRMGVTIDSPASILGTINSAAGKFVSSVENTTKKVQDSANSTVSSATPNANIST